MALEGMQNNKILVNEMKIEKDLNIRVEQKIVGESARYILAQDRFRL